MLNNKKLIKEIKACRKPSTGSVLKLSCFGTHIKVQQTFSSLNYCKSASQMSSEQRTLIMVTAPVFFYLPSLLLFPGLPCPLPRLAQPPEPEGSGKATESCQSVKNNASLAQTYIKKKRREAINLFQRLYRCKVFRPPVQHPLVCLLILLCTPLLFLLLLLFVAIILRLPKEKFKVQ